MDDGKINGSFIEPAEDDTFGPSEYGLMDEDGTVVQGSQELDDKDFETE